MKFALVTALAMFRNAILLLAIHLLCSSAAGQIVVAPVAYETRNGGGGEFGYRDELYDGSGNNAANYSVLTGGTGDLTDGIITNQNWNNNNVPYVGWQWETQNIDIFFQFDQQYLFESVRIWFDDSNGVGGVSPPSTVTINGTQFSVIDPPGSLPFVETFNTSGLFTESISVQIEGRTEWVMISEFEFRSMPLILGDVNLDFVADFSDIPAFITVLQSGEFQAAADVDLNGEVNFLDIPAFIAILMSQ